MFARHILSRSCLLLCFLGSVTESRGAGEFDTFLKPFLAQHCVKCHGEEKVKGKVNLKKIATVDQFLAQPKLINEMIEAVEANDMPPEDEPELDGKERTRLLASLKTLLRESASTREVKQVQIRRLNRFQYNNAIRDLFQLNRDVFSLPEKLMTRHENYLVSSPGKMPEQVKVACHSLAASPGLRGVNSFPKDLRAAHGFDNQANQLTLSPLLLDSFLRLSLSILDSPDFNEQTVGIWNEYFREPAGGDRPAEVRNRLREFLAQAFRRSVDDESLERYTAYTLAKMEQGLSFTDSMKKAASAVLTSPLFLFRYSSADDREDLFGVASNLSFFLWCSGPDRELLRLAASGELAQPEIFQKNLERMFADPKIERFLDTFPSQWMQLENILGATPDPKIARLFSLDKERPASLQMVLEPLLLFDAAFIEDRPIVELIAPKFSYRSEFLQAWYRNDLEPPKIDPAQVVEENRSNARKRKNVELGLRKTRNDLDLLLRPVKARIVAAGRQGTTAAKPLDLKPYAAWEFNGDLGDSVGSLELQGHGNVQFRDGMVNLTGHAYLQSKPLPIDLRAKTLEVWLKVHNVNQRGGGAMGIQGPGDFFDTIVLGERKPRHWISGSNGFSRTEDFPGSTPEAKANQRLHLAMVYQEDGTTTLYRNGEPYGKPFRKGAATFPKNQSSVIFGVRHLPPGGNKHLSISLARARLYNRALSAAEVAASSSGTNYVSDEDLLAALTPTQREMRDSLEKSLARLEDSLKQIPPPRDPRKVQAEARKRFDDEVRNKMRSQTFQRVVATDPRFGGVITNAAMLSMTSGPKRTHPIARGAWMIEVIFNDPPPPPPNDVPPLNEDSGAKNLTIREKFAQHRENPDCAGCHSRLDPLGFALENYDIIGRWRDKYPNGRTVDASGTLMKKHRFDGAVRFKESLVKENRRFAKAFAAHLLRYALARELTPADSLTVDAIVEETARDDFRIRSLIREVIFSESFVRSN